MNLEEVNKWLEKEEGMSYTRLEELHDFFFERYTNLHCILTELERALKDHKEIKEKINTKEYYIEIDEVLDKIQELKEKYK